MAFKYRHGWIKIGGDDDHGGDGPSSVAGGNATRSADRLAAAAGANPLGGKPGARLYTGSDGKTGGAVYTGSNGKTGGRTNAPHVTDGSSHQSHAVDQVASAHDTVIRMPGTDHELGNASMGPQAFQRSLEAHMDSVNPKAGEHIGVARANAKVGFYRAMTAAALVASIGPFGGHEAKGAELLQTGNHEVAHVVEHVASTANEHNKIRFTGHPSTRFDLSSHHESDPGTHSPSGGSSSSLGRRPETSEHSGGGGEGEGHESPPLPTDPGPARNELSEGLKRQDRDPLRLAEQPNEVGTGQLFRPRRKTIVH